MDQIKDHAPESAKIILIGNKLDLKEQRVVSKTRGEELAEKF